MKGVILIVLFIPVLLFAQMEPGARQIATGNSAYAQADDVFSLFYNPAGISRIESGEVGVYYSPAPFGLKELANGSFAVNRNFSFLSAAIGASVFGFSLYKETSIFAGVSKKLFGKFYAGVTFVYKYLSIENYGHASSLVINLGTLYKLTENLRLAFVVNNPFRSSFVENDNSIPTEISVGVSYNPVENAVLNVAATKELDFPVSLKFGLEYGIWKYIDLRFGFESEPELYTSGVGIKYSFVKIDYAAVVHQTLPLSHQVGIILAF